MVQGEPVLPVNPPLNRNEHLIYTAYQQLVASGSYYGRSAICRHLRSQGYAISSSTVGRALRLLRTLNLLSHREVGDNRPANEVSSPSHKDTLPTIHPPQTATLLDLLKSNLDESASLLFLCQELNLSPRAVASEVEGLRQSGEQIDGVEGGGYRWVGKVELPKSALKAVSLEAPPDLSVRLLSHLQRHKDRVFKETELSDHMDVSPRRLREAVETLRGEGYNLYLEDGHLGLTRNDEPTQQTVVSSTSDSSRIRFGALGDTHLGSKFERMDVLNALYDWYAAEGITAVYHTGNMIEGCSSFNVRERHKHGIDEQVDYFIEKYPQREGIITHYITGDDHEGWFQRDAGLSVGKYIQSCAERQGRQDLKYLGFVEHDIEFRNGAGAFMVRIAHPGGGSAYALSYTPQKIVESYSGGEKPSVLLIGHYHKMEYVPAIRGVRVVQTGCTVDQGVWARKKRLAYHLGGWILDLLQCPKTGACIGCRAEDRTFFDKGFYQEWER